MFSCAKHWRDGCRECWLDEERAAAARGPVDYRTTFPWNVGSETMAQAEVDQRRAEEIGREYALALERHIFNVLIGGKRS